MKHFLSRGALAFVLLTTFAFPISSHAALTESQIQSILGLLSSFGAEQSVITNVNASLRGQATGGSSSSSVCLALNNNLYLDTTDASTDGEISKLQAFLGGRVTGYFGPATLQLVQNWQASHGVVSSGSPDTSGYGYVGPKTRAAMRCGNATTYTPPNNTSTTPSTNLTTAQAQATSRDAERLANMKQLQLALELYSDSNGKYPSTLSLLVPTYMALVPVDPLDRSAYPYDQLSGGTAYELGANLETLGSSFVAALQGDHDAASSGGAFTTGSDATSCTGLSGRYCYDIYDVVNGAGTSTNTTSTSAISLVASPSAGYATLWVDFNVSNYTPQGNEFIYFGDGQKTALGYTTPTNGRYDYNIPGTYTATLVRNGVTLASATVTVTGTTVTTPTPSSLKVVSPNGGEAWVAGTDNTITWTPSNTQNSSVQRVDMFLLNSNGQSVMTLGNNRENTGLDYWMPHITGAFKVKICQTGTSNCDESDSLFSIENKIVVTSPTNGSQVSAGHTLAVQWQSYGIESPELFTIWLVDANGSTYSNLATNTSNDGYELVTIPSNTPPGSYSVKVNFTKVGVPSVEGHSASFSVTTATP